MESLLGHVAEMSLEESQDLLRRCGYGRLGLAFESEPYVVPVWHVYDGERVWFHVGKVGKTTTYLQANPGICFEVDEWLANGWASVICYGTVAMTDDLDTRRRFVKLLRGEAPTDEQLSEMDVYVCTLSIEEMTGRKSSGYREPSAGPGAEPVD